jgi:putative phage-type endonuclease
MNNSDKTSVSNEQMHSMEYIEETLDKIEMYLDNMMVMDNDDSSCTSKTCLADDSENDDVKSATTLDEPDWIDTIDETDLIDIDIMIHEIAGDYFQHEIELISKPEFHDLLVNSVFDYVHSQLVDMDMCKDHHTEEIMEYVKTTCNRLFEETIHPRSYPTTFAHNVLSEEEKEVIAAKIHKLSNVYQPKQKTPEWYEFRHKIITASNLWKALSTERQINSLIYEKCVPINLQHSDCFSSNVKSSLHWGVKYEPVTAALYEHIYKTTLGDFGCIVHETYPFIGASPDGINIDPQSNRYGRMIEIKNIVNREINGIPKEEYWIQMQIQMETCDLDECDFMETRYKEYENEEQFYSGEILHDYRGVILYFIKKQPIHTATGMPTHGYTSGSNEPHYRYMPLDIPLEKSTVDEWIQATCEELQKTHILFETQYWYLDELSCVLVKRNREWFAKVAPKITEVWKIIEKERVKGGYEHRAPKKNIPKTEVVHDDTSNSQFIKNMPDSNRICLVKLDENGNAM